MAGVPKKKKKKEVGVASARCAASGQDITPSLKIPHAAAAVRPAISRPDKSAL